MRLEIKSCNLMRGTSFFLIRSSAVVPFFSQPVGHCFKSLNAEISWASTAYLVTIQSIHSWTWIHFC